MEITKEQALEILDKLEFFQGQRAGRELWNEKSFDVQEEDIKAFSRDIELLKKYIADKTTKKHPHFNCQRGMLCPTCDNALWARIEFKGLFGTKKITVKEQPNYCKNCGQPLLYAYTEF